MKMSQKLKSIDRKKLLEEYPSRGVQRDIEETEEVIITITTLHKTEDLDSLLKVELILKKLDEALKREKKKR